MNVFRTDTEHVKLKTVSIFRTDTEHVKLKTVSIFRTDTELMKLKKAKAFGEDGRCPLCHVKACADRLSHRLSHLRVHSTHEER